MAPHPSTLAWKIPWAEEPGRLKSMGSLRVRYDRATSLSLFTFMHWRRKWHPTPVFLPGESQGRGTFVGCRLWGRTKSDMTEVTQQQQQHAIGNEPAGGLFIQFSLVCISSTRKLIDCMTLSLNYYRELIVHTTSVHVQFMVRACSLVLKCNISM